MNQLIHFMASPAGRLLRVFAGIAIIAYGLLITGGTGGKIIASIGLLPILTGVLNICLIGPLIGSPLKGSKLST